MLRFAEVASLTRWSPANRPAVFDGAGRFSGNGEILTETVGCIDSPGDGELVHRHSFACEGWVVSSGERVVEATIDGVLVGSTAMGFPRRDAESALSLGPLDVTGYAISCQPPDGLRDRATAQLVVSVRDSSGVREIGRRWLRFSTFDYRHQGHGGVLSDTHAHVLHRADVYGSGPPSPHADPHVVGLIARWLAPGARILDVGCGIGAFGRTLAPLGYDWSGVEVRPDFVEEMHAAGLRAELYDGMHLPYANASFDAVLCVEVLEHVEDYERFIAEIARVTRRIALFSVPNYEVLPVMARAYAVPWHMLEADHKNFFTRRSLTNALLTGFGHAEAVEYGPLELFTTPDGAPLYNHLFAVATPFRRSGMTVTAG
jgi:2-polyprenyl-3-methyl-5-hydroxy-6-metoxy-1,4-benzoquinol methylase